MAKKKKLRNKDIKVVRKAAPPKKPKPDPKPKPPKPEPKPPKNDKDHGSGLGDRANWGSLADHKDKSDHMDPRKGDPKR